MFTWTHPDAPKCQITIKGVMNIDNSVKDDVLYHIEMIGNKEMFATITGARFLHNRFVSGLVSFGEMEGHVKIDDIICDRMFDYEEWHSKAHLKRQILFHGNIKLIDKEGNSKIMNGIILTRFGDIIVNHDEYLHDQNHYMFISLVGMLCAWNDIMSPKNNTELLKGEINWNSSTNNLQTRLITRDSHCYPTYQLPNPRNIYVAAMNKYQSNSSKLGMIKARQYINDTTFEYIVTLHIQNHIGFQAGSGINDLWMPLPGSFPINSKTYEILKKLYCLDTNNKIILQYSAIINLRLQKPKFHHHYTWYPSTLLCDPNKFSKMQLTIKSDSSHHIIVYDDKIQPSLTSTLVSMLTGPWVVEKKRFRLFKKLNMNFKIDYYAFMLKINGFYDAKIFEAESIIQSIFNAIKFCPGASLINIPNNIAAICFGSHDWKWINNVLARKGSIKSRDVYSMCDEEGKNVIHYMAMINNTYVLSRIWTDYNVCVTVHCASKDKHRNNALHICTRYGSVSLLKEILNRIKPSMSTLLITNNNSEQLNCLNMAIIEDNVKCFELLIKFVAQYYLKINLNGFSFIEFCVECMFICCVCLCWLLVYMGHVYAIGEHIGEAWKILNYVGLSFEQGQQTWMLALDAQTLHSNGLKLLKQASNFAICLTICSFV